MDPQLQYLAEEQGQADADDDAVHHTHDEVHPRVANTVDQCAGGRAGGGAEEVQNDDGHDLHGHHEHIRLIVEEAEDRLGEEHQQNGEDRSEDDADEQIIPEDLGDPIMLAGTEVLSDHGGRGSVHGHGEHVAELGDLAGI